MSGYGLTIYNTAGTVQIDQNYYNLAMRVKGTATFSTAGTNINYYSATINYTGESPVVAYNASFPIGVRQVYNTGGNNWVIELICAAANSGQSATYYIFDRPGGTTTSYGMQVFDGSGNKIFDSGYKYLKFLATQNMDGHSNTGATADITGLPTGRTYATIISRGAFAYFSYYMGNNGQGLQTWDNYIYAIAANATSDGMHMSQFVVREFSSVGSSQGSSTMIGTAMVIDVTGY